jgi:hypothetical protein
MARTVNEGMKLLHGPDKAPRLRRGDHTFRLFKDCDVVVPAGRTPASPGRRRQQRRHGFLRFIPRAGCLPAEGGRLFQVVAAVVDRLRLALSTTPH